MVSVPALLHSHVLEQAPSVSRLSREPPPDGNRRINLLLASGRTLAMIKSDIQSIKKEKHMGLQGVKLKCAFPHHLAQK